MDLVGKAFRNESAMVYVKSMTRSSRKGTWYDVIVFSKEKFSYSIGYNNMLETTIIYTFTIETDSNVVLKAKAMFELNYIACCALAKNTKIVKSSRHVMNIGFGILLWGLYAVNIYKYYISIQPMTESISIYYRVTKHITKKDYNKIFRRVKKLGKDLDKLWTDVV